MSLYVEINHLELREEFLQFMSTFDMTGKGLANLIFDNLQKYSIDNKYLRGQGYDGAASMPGELNGVQAHKKIHPFAMYVHYSAHSLNLLVSKSFNAAEFIQQRFLIKFRYSL